MLLGKDETTLAVFISSSGDLVKKIFLKSGRKSNYALTNCGLCVAGHICSSVLFPGVDMCSPKLSLRDERESEHFLLLSALSLCFVTIILVIGI